MPIKLKKCFFLILKNHEWYFQCIFKILHCILWWYSYLLKFYRTTFQTYFYIAKKNDLVVLKTKISLFQTCVCFLGHHISQETITPIERSLTFASKFSDKILDKTQLQRVLGSLNYVLDFYPNMSRITKLLYDKLRKNHVSWSDEHIRIIRQIKK
jgi:hypothetical protein